MRLCAAAIWIPALLASCRSAPPELVVISADRRIADVAGSCEVRYAPQGETVTVRSEPGHTLHVVTDTWMFERFQLERALRLRIDRCETQCADAARPSGWRPE